jgi:hypothetical protein
MSLLIEKINQHITSCGESRKVLPLVVLFLLKLSCILNIADDCLRSRYLHAYYYYKYSYIAQINSEPLMHALCL